MADLTFKTKVDFGSIGGKKKLTYTSWNDGEYKFDIRDWYDNGNVGKGITLTKDELKSLYGLLKNVYDTQSEETISLDDFLNDEVKDDTEPNNDVVEPTTEQKYPDKIQKIFDELDKMYGDYETERDYGVMAFAEASGERLQYMVKKKDGKNFRISETALNKLGLKHFITDKGNLYIYTL